MHAFTVNALRNYHNRLALIPETLSEDDCEASSLLTTGSSAYLVQGLSTAQAYTNGFRETLGFFLVLSVIGLILAVFARKAGEKLKNQESIHRAG